jgi:hypothetical protein
MVSHAMAHAASRQQLTAEALDHALVCPCGICGGKSNTGNVFIQFFGFPCQYYSTVTLHTHTHITWGMNITHQHEQHEQMYGLHLFI